MSIRKRLLFGYFAVVIIFTAMIYYSLDKSRSSLLQATSQNTSLIAHTILKKIEQNLYSRLELLQWYGLNSDLENALLDSNSQFAAMADRDKFIAANDSEWKATPAENVSPVMKELLSAKLSVDLRQNFLNFFELILGNERFYEVFITNKYGATIAETNRTDDYFQADEEWWQIARQKGQYIGNIEFDESVGKDGIAIAVRLVDKNGEFIGILKAVIPVQGVIRTAEIITREYQSTEIQVVAHDGLILYSSRAVPFGSHISEEPFFYHLKNSENHFLAKNRSGRERLYTYMQSPGLLNVSHLDWGVLVNHDVKEILTTSYLLQRAILVSGIIAIIIVILIAVYTNRMIVQPLNLFHLASVAITRGDLEYQMRYSGHDEFGALAKTFNQMISALSASHKKMSREIELRKEVEEKLLLRTESLARLTEDLTKRNAELNEFTYIASHDLQEPLRKLTAFSGLLKKDLGEDLPANAVKDINFIVDAASRMQTLIQDLLAFSRSGRKAMELEQIDLNGCVDDALYALQTRIEVTNAVIERDVLPAVIGDRILLTQLYQNLIGNALKFIKDDQPRIFLSAKIDGENVELGVQDNGIGIQPQYQDQIFQPFKRLHGKSEYEGSGIGLAICRKVVERHESVLSVKSDVGQGALFTFTLKIA